MPAYVMDWLHRNMYPANLGWVGKPTVRGVGSRGMRGLGWLMWRFVRGWTVLGVSHTFFFILQGFMLDKIPQQFSVIFRESLCSPLWNNPI